MVSPTARTRKIRDNKQKKMGRKRKNQINNQGSTKSQEEMFGSKLPEDSSEKND